MRVMRLERETSSNLSSSVKTLNPTQGREKPHQSKLHQATKMAFLTLVQLQKLMAKALKASKEMTLELESTRDLSSQEKISEVVAT